MFQAIKTKYIGPSNTRGSRVKATAAAGSRTMAWDHRLNDCDNHTAAAKEYAQRMEWTGEWFGGMTEDGSYVFVCATNNPAFRT